MSENKIDPKLLETSSETGLSEDEAKRRLNNSAQT